MPRKCTVCAHPKRGELDAAIAAGEVIRDIARRYETSKDAVLRHKEHVKAAIVKAAQVVEKRDLKRGMTHLERMIAVAADADRLGKLAEENGDLRAALVALREIRETLKDLIAIEAEAGKGAGLDSPDFRAHLERLGDASERMCEPCHVLLVAALGGQG